MHILAKRLVLCAMVLLAALNFAYADDDGFAKNMHGVDQAIKQIVGDDYVGYKIVGTFVEVHFSNGKILRIDRNIFENNVLEPILNAKFELTPPMSPSEARQRWRDVLSRSVDGPVVAQPKAAWPELEICKPRDGYSYHICTDPDRLLELCDYLPGSDGSPANFLVAGLWKGGLRLNTVVFELPNEVLSRFPTEDGFRNLDRMSGWAVRYPVNIPLNEANAYVLQDTRLYPIGPALDFKENIELLEGIDEEGYAKLTVNPRQKSPAADPPQVKIGCSSVELQATTKPEFSVDLESGVRPLTRKVDLLRIRGVSQAAQRPSVVVGPASLASNRARRPNQVDLIVNGTVVRSTDSRGNWNADGPGSGGGYRAGMAVGMGVGILGSVGQLAVNHWLEGKANAGDICAQDILESQASHCEIVNNLSMGKTADGEECSLFWSMLYQGVNIEHFMGM